MSQADEENAPILESKPSWLENSKILRPLKFRVWDRLSKTMIYPDRRHYLPDLTAPGLKIVGHIFT